MQVDIERHWPEANLERAKWKALVLFVATALSAIKPATSRLSQEQLTKQAPLRECLARQRFRPQYD